jgi:hypothetical protein
MIEAAITAGVHVGFVTADEVYGADPVLRAGLRRLGLGYVLAIARNQPVQATEPVRLRPDEIATGLDDLAWERRSCGRGAKGERFYDWAFVHDHTPDDAGIHSLLVRRSTDTGELAFYRCWTPLPVPITTLIRAAGRRWSIEETFQAAKTHIGLDHYQCRGWTAWHRFILLAMLALAILVITLADQPVQPRRPPPRPDHRPDHRRVAPPRRGPGRTPDRPRHHDRLVTLATTPPSHRPTQPLQTPRRRHQPIDHKCRWSTSPTVAAALARSARTAVVVVATIATVLTRRRAYGDRCRAGYAGLPPRVMSTLRPGHCAFSSAVRPRRVRRRPPVARARSVPVATVSDGHLGSMPATAEGTLRAGRDRCPAPIRPLIRGFKTPSKLMVRVRFPSPAPQIDPQFTGHLPPQVRAPI